MPEEIYEDGAVQAADRMVADGDERPLRQDAAEMPEGIFPGESVHGVFQACCLVHRTGELRPGMNLERIVYIADFLDFKGLEQPVRKSVAGFPTEYRSEPFKFFYGNQTHQPFQGLGGSILAYSSRSFSMVTTYTRASIATITAPI